MMMTESTRNTVSSDTWEHETMSKPGEAPATLSYTVVFTAVEYTTKHAHES